MPGGRAWWPINMARLMQLAATNDFSAMRNEVPPGIDSARNALVATTYELLSRYALSPASLTLGGFSQGAMVAVDTVLRGMDEAPKRLVAFSGALICEDLWSQRLDRLASTELLQSHGRYDTILPVESGRWLYGLLQPACMVAKYLNSMVRIPSR